MNCKRWVFIAHLIPSYQDYENCADGNADQLYQFPTQFNSFGQRTNSGVSIVDWFSDRIDLKTRCQVMELEFAETKTDESNESNESNCVAVHVQYVDTGETARFALAEGGRLILCAGAATPKLLLPHRETLNNPDIGKHASDHIVLPLGIYLPGVAESRHELL